jgi:hypothetical protein
MIGTGATLFAIVAPLVLELAVLEPAALEPVAFSGFRGWGLKLKMALGFKLLTAVLRAVFPSGTASVDDASVDGASLDPNDCVDNPCAAARVDANPPAPRCPATGGAMKLAAGSVEMLFEMDSSIGFTALFPPIFSRVRRGSMHSGGHEFGMALKLRNVAKGLRFKRIGLLPMEREIVSQPKLGKV